jgi:FkbM family methyltransferase
LPVRDLIYDIGQHKGEDTAYYLAKGYRVVAVEANPELAASCRERFAAEIRTDRLVLIEGAITDDGRPATLYIHASETMWGTTVTARMHRNEMMGESRPVTVSGVRLIDLLNAYGVPHYLKIDIEGTDRVCLDAIAELDERPSYVSMESTQESYAAVCDELRLLARLGYRRFAVIQQANLPGKTIRTTRLDRTPFQWRIEPDASGGFGDDIQEWTDLDGAFRRYRRIFSTYRLLDNRLMRMRQPHRVRARLSALFVPLPVWYDTHAQR